MLPRGTLSYIPFSTYVFFVLTRATLKAKSPIAIKTLVEKGMYDSVPRGIIKVPISISENFHGGKQVMLYLVHS